MGEKTRGYLTVEATITLTAFLFMMMFLMNMGQIYRTQNYVIHGLLQSGKSVAFSSYEYKQNSAVETIVKVIEMLCMGEVGADNEIAAYCRAEQYDKAVKKTFGYCAGKNPVETSAVLQKYGVSGGIDGIRLNGKKEGKNIVITAEYDIQLPFAFFGFDHVTMHQRVKCGLWS
ncbi:MAG: hypothetical protein HFI47_03430 [Lachnospiraceae bacterium]|jgi:hypothetical protein|nr:hypothetical protein [Lachnospiraceae bacterium]